MSSQKIIKVGNSLGITLPSNLVHSLSIKPGDSVELQQETPTTVTVRFIDSHQLALELSPRQSTTTKII